MTTAGWAWLGLDTVPLSANYAPADRQAEVRLALNGWIYVEPRFSADRTFFERVHNATHRNFPDLFNEKVFPSPYAASMYDAVTLIIMVARQQKWLPAQGGKAFLRESISNTSFNGATGLVKLDANGDLLLSYQAVNLVLKNSILQRTPVGVFEAGTRSYSSHGAAIVWPGGLLARPSAQEEGVDIKYVIMGAVLGAR
jgi:hypothetical protein